MDTIIHGYEEKVPGTMFVVSDFQKGRKDRIMM